MSTRGQRLVEAMQLRGIRKQLALAYVLGVNESTVSRWKKDGPMSVDHAVSICDHLEISLDWFLTGNGPIARSAAAAPDRVVDDHRLCAAFCLVTGRMKQASKPHLAALLESLAE